MALAEGTIVTVGGIDAEVFCDGYEKGNSLRGDGPWRRVAYLVDWDASDLFIDALLGIPSSQGGPGGVVLWPIPHSYPGNPALVAHDAHGTPCGGVGPDPTKVVRAAKCRVDVTYRVPAFDVTGGANPNAFGGRAQPWSRDRIRGARVGYRVPGGSLTYKDSGDPYLGDSEVYLLHLNCTRTLFMVPYYALEIIRSLSGKVNDAPIFDCDTGTLKLSEFDADREVAPDGDYIQQYDLNYEWREVDWNKELRDDELAWEVVWDEANGLYRYPYADFSPLLNLGL